MKGFFWLSGEKGIIGRELRFGCSHRKRKRGIELFYFPPFLLGCFIWMLTINMYYEKVCITNAD